MNTSSRMMSSGEEQRIHTSKVTADLLPREFQVCERGQIEVKGKGRMTTCWVQDRAGRSPPNKDQVLPWLYSSGLCRSFAYCCWKSDEFEV